MPNFVYIATSLDGYISDKDDGLDWLELVPNPDNLDLGWTDFMNRVDALIMGRKTFEKVCSFDCDWPYEKPVFVLSNSLKVLPQAYEGRAEVINGALSDVIKNIKDKGYENLYIDGGVTVQNFLIEDLIDEMIITIIPVLLGGGTPLFADLPDQMQFQCIKSETLLNDLVQTHYRRKR